MVDGERMVEIWYTDLNGVRRTKTPDKQDLEKFSRIEKKDFASAIKENRCFGANVRLPMKEWELATCLPFEITIAYRY